MLAQRVVFGAGRIDDLPSELDARGSRRAFLVATGSAKPVADHLARLLGGRLVGRVHEVVQHVPVASVEACLARVIDADADALVAVGGGSAIGLGKAVAVQTGLPVFAVPTTYSGSEATPIYGVTDRHKKTARDPRALPVVVVYDARLTLSLPRRATATSGLNAMAHAVEALYAPGSDPVTSLLAEEAIRVLARSLPVAAEAPHDLPAREDALYGAYLAGSALAMAGTALHHAVCHVIGGTYGLEHGDLHAVLLPHTAAYNAAAAPDALERVAAALRTSEPGTTEAPAGLHRLARRLDAPTDLASLGLPEAALDDIAERTAVAVGHRNPRTADMPSLRRMLGDAHAGRPPGTDRTTALRTGGDPTWATGTA